MPRAAEASRLLLRAAAAQRAWWSASSSPLAASASSAAMTTTTAPWSRLSVGGVDPQQRSIASEAAARARRLAAAQARRQKQHELAAARLARAPAAHHNSDNNSNSNSALTPTTRTTTSSLLVDRGSLAPADAVAVARAVAHPALVVTRAVEWGTVVFGFEQANKYTVYDQDGSIVALIAEDETGLGNAVGRQLLRTRRAFTATVLSPDDGSVIFRVRRPAYLVSSTTFVENGDGLPIGEVRQRWHPLRRNFDLYVGQRQYARISGPLLAWEFQLTDDGGRPLALIDRNFQGFAKELFTDAGKYVVHFGLPPEESAAVATRTLEARSGRSDLGAVAPLQIGGVGGGGGGAGAAAAAAAATATAPPGDAVAVIPQVTGGQLAVARPLALDERMVALAAAVAIDFAFFSQHSHTSGMFAPPLIFPMPLPGGGVGAEAGAEGGEGEAAGGEGGASAAGGEAGVGGGFGGGAGAASTAGGGGAADGGASTSGRGGGGGGDEGWSWDDDKGGGGGGGAGDDSAGWSPWGGGGDSGNGDGGVGDDGEGGGTVGSVVRGLWRVFGDDD